jgi:hypothetical protein
VDTGPPFALCAAFFAGGGGETETSTDTPITEGGAGGCVGLPMDAGRAAAPWGGGSSRDRPVGSCQGAAKHTATATVTRRHTEIGGGDPPAPRGGGWEWGSSEAKK